NHHGRVRERPLASVPSGSLPERDRLHQGVAAEAVGAVDRHTGDLARCIEPDERSLPPYVRVDAAHVVVRAGTDRDRLIDRIAPGEHHRELTRSMQTLEDAVGAEMAEVEQHVAVDAATLVDLGLLGTGNDIA